MTYSDIVLLIALAHMAIKHMPETTTDQVITKAAYLQSLNQLILKFYQSQGGKSHERQQTHRHAAKPTRVA